MKLDSVEAVLDYAIGKEQDAAHFYTELANKMKYEHMKEIFMEFAEEEKRHEAKLKSVKSGKIEMMSDKKVQDLKIGDHLVEVDLDTNLDYQQALIVAMKAEKAAYKLYNDLATTTEDAAMRDLFLGLAQEEAKHKLRFEIEYDEAILTEN